MTRLDGSGGIDANALPPATRRCCTDRTGIEVYSVYKLMAGEWYVLFTCENCKTRQMLFPDLTAGKADLSLCSYGLDCRYCAHHAYYDNRRIERYQHPPEAQVAVAH